MANLNNRILGRIALIGIGAVLVIDLIDAAKSSGSVGMGFAVWLVMTAAAAGTSLVLMPKASMLLLRNLQLLVPLGLLIITTRLLGWLMLLPALGSLLTRSVPFQFLSFSTALSFSLVVYILLSVAYAAWTTLLVVRCVNSDVCDPASVISAARQKLLHIFGMECIGTIILMLGSTLFLLLMKASFVIALGGMALFGIAWNFATAALLPVTVEHKGNFTSAFRAGVGASLANAHRWGLLLIAQMFLLGLVIYYYRSSGGTSNSDFAVNTFWIGGYESDCRWYPSVAKRFNTFTIPLFETLLSLVFGIFAVGIKLAITQRLGKRS